MEGFVFQIGVRYAGTQRYSEFTERVCRESSFGVIFGNNSESIAGSIGYLSDASKRGSREIGDIWMFGTIRTIIDFDYDGIISPSDL